MRTFTCCSTFLYGTHPASEMLNQLRGPNITIITLSCKVQTRVAGLEDDLYSVSGETDYANLSPSPLVPNFPSSQLVPKIYTENQVYFFIRTFALISRF
jgi:hypothetical protein